MQATISLPEQLAVLGDEIAKYSTRIIALLDQERLSPTQRRALHLIASAPEPLSVSGLANGLGLSLSAVSRTAHALLERDLLTCAVATEDKRCRKLAPTAEGLRIWQTLNTARLADLQDYADSLTGAQRDRLAKALNQLNRHERD